MDNLSKEQLPSTMGSEWTELTLQQLLADIHVERYRSVRIVLTTHATGGISDADVALARTIEGVE